MHPAILIVFAPPCRMALMVSSRTILSVACARASESRARGTRNLIATDVSPTWGLMENSTAFSMSGWSSASPRRSQRQFLSSSRLEAIAFDANSRCCMAVGGALSGRSRCAALISIETPVRFCASVS